MLCVVRGCLQAASRTQRDERGYVWHIARAARWARCRGCGDTHDAFPDRCRAAPVSRNMCGSILASTQSERSIRPYYPPCCRCGPYRRHYTTDYSTVPDEEACPPGYFRNTSYPYDTGEQTYLKR